MNNKVFISGKITGNPTWQLDFYHAEQEVTSMDFFNTHGDWRLPMKYDYFGFSYVSPRLFKIEHLRYWAQITVCVFHLLGCSYVYMLNNWRESRGARIEHFFAKLTFKKIIYQKQPWKGKI